MEFPYSDGIVAPPSVNYKRIGLRRTAQWLLDLLFPLYTFGLTRERRRYWQLLPARRAAKLFVALFLILSGVAFFIDLLAGGIYPLWGRLPRGGVTWGAACRRAAMNQKIKGFARSGSRIRLNSEGAWIVAGEVSGER